MAKVHQNAQGKGGNQRQQAAGYRYGGSAVPIEILNDPAFFPLGPGGVKPDPSLAMPDFAGPWGAGSKPVAAKTGGGGGSDGGGEKGKRQTDKGPLRHVGGAGSGKENFAGKPAAAKPTQFSPDLAVSPNPYQMGSPVDPRPSAASNAPPFQGPPMPTQFSPDLAPSINPFQPGSPVATPEPPYGRNPWTEGVGNTANPFAVDPQQTSAAGGTQFNPLVRALIERAMAGRPDTGVPGAPAVGSSPPVVGSGGAVGGGGAVGAGRPVIDINKLLGG